jgi:hypothetical protein
MAVEADSLYFPLILSYQKETKTVPVIRKQLQRHLSEAAKY